MNLFLEAIGEIHDAEDQHTLTYLRVAQADVESYKKFIKERFDK